MQTEPNKLRIVTKWFEGEASGRWGIIALLILAIAPPLIFNLMK